MNEGDLWIDDLLGESISRSEMMWKEIYAITDKFNFIIKFMRYPLALDTMHYVITIYKAKDGKWVSIYQQKGMELLPLLRKVKIHLQEYELKHKEYIVMKPGAGELI